MTIGNDPTRVELYRASGDVLATDDVILSTVASGKNTISPTGSTPNGSGDGQRVWPQKK